MNTRTPPFHLVDCENDAKLLINAEIPELTLGRERMPSFYHTIKSLIS